MSRTDFYGEEPANGGKHVAGFCTAFYLLAVSLYSSL